VQVWMSALWPTVTLSPAYGKEMATLLIHTATMRPLQT
jgi:hypothetical protein